MFQEHTLFPWMTVRGNIAFALKGAKLYKRERSGIYAWLEMAGLTEFAKSYPHQLSCQENAANSGKSDAEVAAGVSDALKARTGVKPAKVNILPDGIIERSTHKAKRITDERKLNYSI
jgi:hypothetical protein